MNTSLHTQQHLIHSYSEMKHFSQCDVTGEITSAEMFKNKQRNWHDDN